MILSFNMLDLIVPFVRIGIGFYISMVGTRADTVF